MASYNSNTLQLDSPEMKPVRNASFGPNFEIFCRKKQINFFLGLRIWLRDTSDDCSCGTSNFPDEKFKTKW